MEMIPRQIEEIRRIGDIQTGQHIFNSRQMVGTNLTSVASLKKPFEPAMPEG